MVFKDICVLALWMKVASALKGLRKHEFCISTSMVCLYLCSCVIFVPFLKIYMYLSYVKYMVNKDTYIQWQYMHLQILLKASSFPIIGSLQLPHPKCQSRVLMPNSKTNQLWTFPEYCTIFPWRFLESSRSNFHKSCSDAKDPTDSTTFQPH